MLNQDVDGVLDIHARRNGFYRSSLYHGLACECISADHVYHTKTYLCEFTVADMR